jgi:hypothetical protein
MGDHYFTDVRATHALNEKLKASGSKARWDSIALMSEMSWLFRSRQEEKDPVLIQHNTQVWGSSYFLDNKNLERTSSQGLFTEISEGNTFYKNFFVTEAEKIARYAIPYVKSMYYLMGDLKD